MKPHWFTLGPYLLSCREATIDTQVVLRVPLRRYEGYAGLKRLKVEVGEDRRKEDNMARIPIATRESVPENQRAAFDQMAQRTGSVPQHGPGSVMIHVPEAQRLAGQLSNWIVSSTAIPNAMHAMRLVEAFKGMPESPRTPKKSATGRTLGSSAMKPMRQEVNMAARTK